MPAFVAGRAPVVLNGRRTARRSHRRTAIGHSPTPCFEHLVSTQDSNHPRRAQKPFDKPINRSIIASKATVYPVHFLRDGPRFHEQDL